MNSIDFSSPLEVTQEPQPWKHVGDSGPAFPSLDSGLGDDDVDDDDDGDWDDEDDDDFADIDLFFPLTLNIDGYDILSLDGTHFISTDDTSIEVYDEEQLKSVLIQYYHAFLNGGIWFETDNYDLEEALRKKGIDITAYIKDYIAEVDELPDVYPRLSFYCVRNPSMVELIDAAIEGRLCYDAGDDYEEEDALELMEKFGCDDEEDERDDITSVVKDFLREMRP